MDEIWQGMDGKLCNKPYAFQALFIISFIEASFFPLPPDILLLAIAISAPKQGFRALFGVQ
jgi:membrane protein YqaA with SNARE-associated domain